MVVPHILVVCLRGFWLLSRFAQADFSCCPAQFSDLLCCSAYVGHCCLLSRSLRAAFFVFPRLLFVAFDVDPLIMLVTFCAFGYCPVYIDRFFA